MEKITIEENIPYSFSWTFGVEISEIRTDLDKVEKLGATHINIEYGSSWNAPYCDIEAVNKRVETDEEFNTRKRKENNDKQTQKQRDLKELQRLQNLYKAYENG
jgi:hypothetical protein